MVIASVMCRSVVYFKQQTAYEIRVRDWSSDVCSSDLDDTPVALVSILLKFAELDKQIRPGMSNNWADEIGERRVGKECRSRWSP